MIPAMNTRKMLYQHYRVALGRRLLKNNSNTITALLPNANTNNNATISHNHNHHQHYQRATFGTGSRGARGHGWYVNYRAGKGGRHLQGRFFERKQQYEQIVEWNNTMMNFGNNKENENNSNVWVYLDVELRPASAVVSAASNKGEENQQVVEEEEEQNEEKVEEQEAAASSSSSSSSRATVTEEEILVERLKIEMNPRIMPNICNNFINLCENVYGSKKIGQLEKNIKLYRIIREVGLCGGDILTNTGKTGQSYNKYVNEPISDDDIHPLCNEKSTIDEPLVYYSLAGYVSMICPKVNHYDSRFLLLTEDSFHLDGYHIVFGRLCNESLQKVQYWCNELLLTRDAGKPKNYELTIIGSGLLPNNGAVEKNGDDKGDDHVQKQQQQQQNEAAM